MKRPEREVLPPTYSPEALKKQLLCDAKAVGLADSTAKMIVDKILIALDKWAAKRSAVTLEDIYLRVAKEAKRYNADLAYVYQNRGKII